MAELTKRSNGQQGFSLVELLVVILITAVVGSGVVAAVASAARAERGALDLRENTDSARLAVERLRDTVRSAFGVCDGSTGARAVLWLGDAGALNDRVDVEELVTFSFVDGELLRADGGAAPRAVAFGLGDDAAFAYADRDGDPADLPVDIGVDCASTSPIEGRGDVAAVDVTVSGDQAPDGRTSATVSNTRLSLRNAAITDGTINPNRPPTAAFTQSCSGTVCSFDASGSFDEDGTIDAYRWTFGDASPPKTGVTTSHTYLTNGGYNVALTVVDDGGVSTTLTQFVGANLEEDDLGDSTGNAAPSASFTSSCSGLNCTFNAGTSFDSDGSIVSYAWDFGDNGAVSSGVATSHVFTAPSSYSVSLTLIDNDGAQGTHTDTINPTATAATIKVTALADTSFKAQSKGWTPRAQITVQYADGAPAAGIRLNGRFGPENSTDLKSGSTNAQGIAVLQANGSLGNNTKTYLFTVLSADGPTITSGPTSLVLTNKD